MLTINSAHIPWFMQLLILVVGVILVASTLRFLIRLAWRIIGLVFTLLIIVGGVLLVLQFLHQ
jgi:hypothetical protein